MLDPFGLSPLAYVTKYWTASERNTLLPADRRACCSPTACCGRRWRGVFAIAYRCFRFETRFARRPGVARPSRDAARLTRAQKAAPPPGRARRARRAQSAPACARCWPPIAPRLRCCPTSAATRATRGAAVELARFDMAFVFRSPAFFVLIAIGLLLRLGSR